MAARHLTARVRQATAAKLPLARLAQSRRLMAHVCSQALALAQHQAMVQAQASLQAQAIQDQAIQAAHMDHHLLVHLCQRIALLAQQLNLTVHAWKAAQSPLMQAVQPLSIQVTRRHRRKAMAATHQMAATQPIATCQFASKLTSI